MARNRILVVDDEEDILEFVRYNLAKEGYQIICIESGEDCVKTAREKLPDLIILDIMLPGIDGLDVCKILRGDSKTQHIPIIMLTAKGDEADIITGLELGADDYIVKPFSPRVLNARVKALLRRVSQVNKDEKVIKRHNLVINPGRREVLVDGKAVDLTFSEFEILHFLSKRPGWVFTRNQLVNNIKGGDYSVTERTIDVQIVGLRKKLGSAGKYIETVRGVGYRFRD